jgi:hypothetical protein
VIGGLLTIFGVIAVMAVPSLLLLLLVGGDLDQADGTLGVLIAAVFVVSVVGGFLGWVIRTLFRGR